MEPLFLHIPSGEWLSAHHIVTLAVEGSGIDDQLRHTVYAHLTTGEKQLLDSYQGVDSQREAQAYVDELLAALHARTFEPRR